MRLRLIIFVLALQAFFSAVFGGWIYFSSLKQSAFDESQRRSSVRIELINRHLSSYLSENVKPVKALAGLKELSGALVNGDLKSLARANSTLDNFQNSLYLETCYLMDDKGITIASSNRNFKNSFVGKDFSFRPYYKTAMGGVPVTYLALGTTSNNRGVYSSHPVYDHRGGVPIGVVVIKSSVELIETELFTEPGEIIFVVDPMGIIFISSRKLFLFKTMDPLSGEGEKKVSLSRQFGMGPWKWSGFTRQRERFVSDIENNDYLINSVEIDNYPGWKIVHLRNLEKITGHISDPLIRMSGSILILFSLLSGVIVYFLYQKAVKEIVKRKTIEDALRESEKRYRSIYHNTPALLHSIDTDGRLINISDHWAEYFGYTRDEVIGRKLTDFFTQESRTYAETTVFPEFFRKGYNNDIPYRFVKKDGEVLDILLSCYGVRDLAGNIDRTLAISVDVTEWKKAREALHKAKETLRDYSRDLERQVRQRTGEITGFFEHTPAVIYIKNIYGRYRLVNSEFEKIFNLTAGQVRDRTDDEVLAWDVARQFTKNDMRAVDEKKACQMSEIIEIEDGVHTFLSTKFPVFDEQGGINGICSISTDVTELQNTQDKLRSLSRSIMAGQERERATLARELHDELGQVLTVLRMDSVWMEKRLDGDDVIASSRILSMQKLIDKTIQDVRQMSFRLRPGILDDLGLVDALESLTSDFEKRTEITCVFEKTGVPFLDDTASTAVYRIVQEAMTNAARYAGASRINVVLKVQELDLIVEISDNGCGFDLENMSDFTGFGMVGMYERADLAGGTLSVSSFAGGGTRITCEVPLTVKRN